MFDSENQPYVLVRLSGPLWELEFLAESGEAVSDLNRAAILEQEDAWFLAYAEGDAARWIAKPLAEAFIVSKAKGESDAKSASTQRWLH